MLNWVLLVLGFVLVIKGADFLVDGASSIARRLKVSDLVIGLTLVAFGTSLPELAVNVFASASGNADIAFGNILGSNICNILLILGVAAVIWPMTLTSGTIWKEVPLTVLAGVMVFILTNDRLIDGDAASTLTRVDGFVLLAFFMIFMYYVFGISTKGEAAELDGPTAQYSMTKAVVASFGGLALLVVGGRLVVDGAVGIASSIGVSQSVIGLTIVALGTSLPELATSAVAAFKRNSGIAVGNVVGSNIFNIFFILGLSSVIRPLPVGAGTNMDIAVVILASVLLFATMFMGQKRVVERWQGAIFVALYAAYIVYLVAERAQTAG
jgi:cation:H+ antiporter